MLGITQNGVAQGISNLKLNDYNLHSKSSLLSNNIYANSLLSSLNNMIASGMLRKINFSDLDNDDLRELDQFNLQPVPNENFSSIDATEPTIPTVTSSPATT